MSSPVSPACFTQPSKDDLFSFEFGSGWTLQTLSELREHRSHSIYLQGPVTMSADSQATAPANPTTWLQNLGIAIEIICPALALIVTLLRIYVRVSTKSFGWGR